MFHVKLGQKKIFISLKISLCLCSNALSKIWCTYFRSHKLIYDKIFCYISCKRMLLGANTLSFLSLFYCYISNFIKLWCIINCICVLQKTKLKNCPLGIKIFPVWWSRIKSQLSLSQNLSKGILIRNKTNYTKIL